jgi:DEAD/DEAH box helicase domain-containing protein
VSAGAEVITADQPNLEGIPDRISLDRNHGQYALFWPSVAVPQTTEWTHQHKRRRWVEAKLDTTTGVLVRKANDRKPLTPTEIAGRLYVVSDDGTNEPALPTRCPCCDADFSRHENNPTPLRNHRTGFQKSAQVIAAGLLREMPKPDRPDSRSSRKLVIFSDSRQDAAKLAAGMQRDHYRDLVRMALIRVIDEYWDDLVAFLREQKAISGGNIPRELQANNPVLAAVVGSARKPEDTVRRNRFMARHNDLTTEALLWWMSAPPANKSSREAWLALLSEYPGRISLDRVGRAIASHLLELGINPGGVTTGLLNFRTGSGQSQPWYTAYEWVSEGAIQPVTEPSDTGRDQHVSRINSQLRGELMYALFPHKARTIEGLVQGQVTYRPATGSPSEKRVFGNFRGCAHI